MQSKYMEPGVESGVSAKEKFDPQKPMRPETNEMSQRPVQQNETIKSDRGSFKVK